MTHAEMFAHDFRVTKCYPETVQHSLPGVVCEACQRGGNEQPSSNSFLDKNQEEQEWRRPLVECTVTHRYIRNMTQRVLLCFMCLDRTLHTPPGFLTEARRRYTQMRNTESFPRLFVLLQSCPPVVREHHPIIAPVVNAHNACEHLSPAIVADAMRVLLVYHADPELVRNYCWLVQVIKLEKIAGQKKESLVKENLVNDLVAFAGIGGDWPGIERRGYISQLRRQHEARHGALKTGPSATDSTDV